MPQQADTSVEGWIVWWNGDVERDKCSIVHKFKLPLDSLFGRVVLIGGADPQATQPENPTLAHLAQ